MYKMRLILADPDNKYVDRVVDYIKSKFSAQIKISSYTKFDRLMSDLPILTEQVDVLLISQQFLAEETDLFLNIGMVVLLTDGHLTSDAGEYASIYKYQPGEQLVTKLFDLYSQKNVNVAKLLKGTGNTRFIAVYSPAGGTGKTSVVLGLAKCLTDKGFSVFCLSLESLSSLSLTLQANGKNGFTHILLSLEKSAEVLPVRIAMHKTKDQLTGLEFFEPPDCFLEMECLKPGVIETLFKGFKHLGKYDYILIDTDSIADEKTLNILEQSDKVVLVLTTDSTCTYKTRQYLEQLGRIGRAERAGILEKIIPVVNKSEQFNQLQGELPELNIRFLIPPVDNLWTSDSGRSLFDSNHFFQSAMCGLVENLIQEGE